jgi:DNA-binding transcriptional LysR family regulator
MEEMLGTKLLERFGQEFRFTEAGKEIFHRAVAMEELARELNDRVRALDVSPGGTVKLAVTEGLASMWIAGRLAIFCRDNPEINIELIPSHGEYDLLTSGIDVAIGWHRPTEPRLVGSKIGSVGFNLFASQDYVSEHGPFRDAADVPHHRFVQYDTHDIQGWSAGLMQKVREANRFSLRTSSIFVYLAAVRGSLGIGLLPSFYDDRYPELVKMPAELSDRGEIWIVSHEETNRFRRTQLLLEFLRQDIRKNGRHLFS